MTNLKPIYGQRASSASPIPTITKKKKTKNSNPSTANLKASRRLMPGNILDHPRLGRICLTAAQLPRGLPPSTNIAISTHRGFFEKVPADSPSRPTASVFFPSLGSPCVNAQAVASPQQPRGSIPSASSPPPPPKTKSKRPSSLYASWYRRRPKKELVRNRRFPIHQMPNISLVEGTSLLDVNPRQQFSLKRAPCLQSGWQRSPALAASPSPGHHAKYPSPTKSLGPSVPTTIRSRP